MKKIMPILMAFFLVGCAGNIKITGSGCQAFGAQFMNINQVFSPSVSWEKKVWTKGGDEESTTLFLMKDLLREKNIECKEIEKIRYTIKQNFMDQVFSIIPFRQRMTIKIEVETKS